MLVVLLFALFVSIMIAIMAIFPSKSKPTLMMDMQGGGLGQLDGLGIEQKPKTSKDHLMVVLSRLAIFNKPLAFTPSGREIGRQLAISRSTLSVEVFYLIVQILIVFGILLVMQFSWNTDYFYYLIFLVPVIMFILPHMILRGDVNRVKDSLLRELPDTVDLLALCVNAGLDFMMALKYVVEKSQGSVLVEELRNMMQEINVGKPRRDALRDMARKYEMPDLSTFSRTLIQADRMGTSVSEALNILSEDMRETRFRRGEAMALKAPLKMLIPLLLFIFPVVGILVAGPVFLDFFQNNAISQIGH